MTTMSRECREIEPDLIAVATAEAPAAAARGWSGTWNRARPAAASSRAIRRWTVW
jgi:hypothetical protein